MNSGGREDSVVRLRGIRKRFGYREVLRGVDLEIEAGACVALVGPNGAGKSTLMRIVSTQWSPTAGTGSVFGADLKRERLKIRCRIGVVFHQSFLRPELTLDENLRFAGDLYGRRSVSRGREFIERLGLGPRRHDPVGTFSQGMTKRASIARSLMHDPELWLLDEPFSGLDPGGREQLSGLVREFSANGKTVLLVTHQLSIAERLATRVIEVTNGTLEEKTAPATSTREEA